MEATLFPILFPWIFVGFVAALATIYVLEETDLSAHQSACVVAAVVVFLPIALIAAATRGVAIAITESRHQHRLAAKRREREMLVEQREMEREADRIIAELESERGGR